MFGIDKDSKEDDDKVRNSELGKMMDYQLISGKAGGDKIAKDYNVRGIPSTRLISPQKKVEVGGNHPNVSAINNKLQAAGLKEEDCDNVNINNQSHSLIVKPSAINLGVVSFQDITLSVPQNNSYTIVLYSANGKISQTIAADFLAKGKHTLSWDGTDLSAGVYIIQITSTTHHLQSKVVLSK